VQWHGHAALMLVVPQGLAEHATQDLVVDWIARHRPDAVFAQSAAMAAALPRLKRLRPRLDFRLIGLGAHTFGGGSYLDECAELVGSAVIDLLGGMMYYHETGIPDHPRTTAIDGNLVERGTGGRRGPKTATASGKHTMPAGSPVRTKP
jgi:hypothetical protein